MINTTLSVIFSQDSKDVNGKTLNAITVDNYGLIELDDDQWIILDDSGDLYMYNLSAGCLYKRNATDLFELLSEDATAIDIILEKTVQNKSTMMSLLSNTGLIKHGYFYKK